MPKGPSFVALFAVAAAVAVGTARANVAPVAATSGTGSWAGGQGTFSVSAARNASRAAIGSFEIRTTYFFSGHASVTCLAARTSDHTAVVVGRLDEPVFFDGRWWDYAGLWLRDNGSLDGQPDQITPFVAFGPAGCFTLLDWGAQFALPLATGNVSILSPPSHNP